MVSLLILGLLSAVTPALRIDLNRATLQEILQLPIGEEDAQRLAAQEHRSVEEVLQTARIPRAKAESLYVWIRRHGPLRSYYELSRIPTITPGDLKRWKPYIVIVPLREGRNFALYVERIRQRGASEEAPRESYYDEWIGFLTEPINVNRATVDELYSLYGVSLIDAASVVRYARVLRLRHGGDLRRVPGLSYYGYRNMRNFVAYREPRTQRVRGWLHLDTYYSPYLYTAGSDLYERIQQLESTEAGSLDSLLQAQGWSPQEVERFLARLNRERAEAEALQHRPSFRFKGRLSLYGRYRLGFLYRENPYLGPRPQIKAFFELVNLGPLRRLIVGDYRVTLAQALLVDNSEEARSRILDRPYGIYGDQTSQRSFNFEGVAAQLRQGPVAGIFFYSLAPRHFVPKRDGTPNFYYTGTFIPSDFKNRLLEETRGAYVTYDLPLPWFPTGSQVGLGYLQIDYPQALNPDFSEMDLPGDRESLGDDASFLWVGGKTKRFYNFTFRWVRAPVSLELEAAHEERGGNALVAKGRLQFNPLYFNVLVRHYEPDYTNPYMRPFQEDTRFADTPMERPYRLLDPLYSELATFPMPKPETGFYIETRYQFAPKILTPRTYVDVWRDNTDGLWNYRLQAEVELRPVHPFRIRLKQKWQKRRNRRNLEVTESFTRETTLRMYAILGRGDFVGFEGRYGAVDLKERLSYPEDEINGGFVAANFTKRLSEKSEVRVGYIVWRTNGMSQWAFEDTGIDFLYGDGDKWYIAWFHRPTPNLGLKLKVRFKNTRFPHTGLFGEGAHFADGSPVLGFTEVEPFHSVSLFVDYSF